MLSNLIKHKLFSKTALILFVVVLFPSFSYARTLVLVHGYLSDGMVWRRSGFTQPLLSSGWIDGGGFGYNQAGMLLPRGLTRKGDVFFTVNLPSEANLQTQESLLLRYLDTLYLQRGEPITLVGHSAGGVVARLYAIDPRRQPVNGLITIASPHLGTPTANLAELAGNSPLGMMASMAGLEELQDSRGLFSDLAEENNHNFLGWMNHQPHPDIFYASIIRQNNNNVSGLTNFIVPAYSQNMNNVWALRGRSGTSFSQEGHGVTVNDGRIVIEIIKYQPLF